MTSGKRWNSGRLSEVRDRGEANAFDIRHEVEMAARVNPFGNQPNDLGAEAPAACRLEEASWRFPRQSSAQTGKSKFLARRRLAGLRVENKKGREKVDASQFS